VKGPGQASVPLLFGTARAAHAADVLSLTQGAGHGHGHGHGHGSSAHGFGAHGGGSPYREPPGRMVGGPLGPSVLREALVPELVFPSWGYRNWVKRWRPPVPPPPPPKVRVCVRATHTPRMSVCLLGNRACFAVGFGWVLLHVHIPYMYAWVFFRRQ
jgi:hypothetical protein